QIGREPGDVQVLGEALALEADPRVREAIFTSLVRTGGDAAIGVVLPHMRSDDATLRTGALDALRAMARSTVSVLGDLLHDPDTDVRILACEIAREAPPADASRLLAEVLSRETEANVCGAAVEVLAEIGGPEALSALTACADRFPQESFLRFAIKVACERIGAPPRG
ncbi:MAG TPA: HEAT repeat domain-containing protein, partial [Phenylobacterium sp.]